VAGGTIRGRVVRADNGRPVSKARVSAIGRSRGSGLRETTTDATGRYEFSTLPPTEYMIRVTRAGFLKTSFKDAGGKTSIIVRPGSLVAGVDISMSPAAGVIAGQVLDETGEPVPGAQVRAIPRAMLEGASLADTPPGATTVADDFGRFRLFGLLRGDYYVRASVSSEFLRGYGGMPGLSPGTFYPLAHRLDAQPVHVESSVVAGVVMTIETRPVTLRGQIIGVESGSGTRLTLAPVYGDTGQQAVSVSLAPDGSFEVPKVFPGEYTLVATTEDGIASSIVTVDNADVDVPLVVHPPGIIRGQLSFDSSAARSQLVPAGVSIRAEVLQGSLRTTASTGVDRAWSFALRDLQGPARLEVQLPGGWMVSRIMRGGDDITDRVVDFSDTSSAMVDVRVTKNVTSVNGSVVDQRGRPLSDAQVVIFAEDGERWQAGSRYVRSVRPDQTGRFAIEGLPPGRYLAVAVTPAEGQGTYASRLEQLRPFGERITVQLGGTKTIPLRAVAVP
jgi:protocatechuate 3,4-dioxygenase beta subunit